MSVPRSRPIPPTASASIAIAKLVTGSCSATWVSHASASLAVYGCGNTSRRLSQIGRLSACLTSADLSLRRQGRIRQGPASRGNFGTIRTSCSLLVARAISNIYPWRRPMTDWLATRLQPALAAIDTPFQWLICFAGGRTAYEISQWLFLRALGLIYLIAFVSLWVQVKGLIGPHGILPAQDYLQALRRYVGPDRYRIVPSVLWLDASGRALDVVCALGVICAALLVADVRAGGVMICLWVLYLSLVASRPDFLSFGPRPLRLLAVAGTVLFQLTIFATGNYNFFNLLTIALVLLLVDDAAWRSLLPDALLARLPSSVTAAAGAPFVPPGAGRMAVTVVVAAVFLVLGALRLWESCFPRTRPP